MSDKSFERYFQEELSKVRGLAREFSAQHPAVAPLLSANSSDPDAERLLEGVAFLMGMLHKKLDDDFPEVIHGLMNILFPHYLRPIPALSILKFSPKPSLREKIIIPKGTIANSTPVDEVECSFATTTEFNIYPIEIKKSTYKLGEKEKSSLELEINLINTSLNALDLNQLSFYLGDSFTNSSNIFMLLNHYLSDISIELDDGDFFKLSKDALECEGFKRKSSLFSYPKNAFSSYRILQEYFVLPQKFFFFALSNLEDLKKYNSKSFKIIFHFTNSSMLSSIADDAIKLFCTPVTNLFEAEAEPITLSHKKELIRIYPPARYRDKYQVYDIKNVSSYVQGEIENREYLAFESFEKDTKNNKNIYQVYRKKSVIDAKEVLYIGLHYRDELPTNKEVLSIKISCTNGSLSERLQLGEISQSSDNSPELTTFKNIIPCTMQIDSPVDENSLWQFISHLSINLLTLADIRTFKEMLKLYMFSNNRDKSKVAKNQKRIDAIEDFEVQSIDRVSRGYLLKGHKVIMKVRQDYFASIGDMYLFCSVILEFLGSYAALNTFVELEVKEKITGESLSWAPILGNKKLI